jgi:hypothetical protein
MASTDWMIMSWKNVEESCRIPNLSYYWRYGGKLRIRVVHVPVDIRTWHHPNTSRKPHRLSQLTRWFHRSEQLTTTITSPMPAFLMCEPLVRRLADAFTWCTLSLYLHLHIQSTGRFTVSYRSRTFYSECRNSCRLICDGSAYGATV